MERAITTAVLAVGSTGEVEQKSLSVLRWNGCMRPRLADGHNYARQGKENFNITCSDAGCRPQGWFGQATARSGSRRRSTSRVAVELAKTLMNCASTGHKRLPVTASIIDIVTVTDPRYRSAPPGEDVARACAE